MIPGCLSACSPCSHQKKDPFSICDICQQSYDTYVQTTQAKAIADAKALLKCHGYTVSSPQDRTP